MLKSIPILLLLLLSPALLSAQWLRGSAVVETGLSFSRHKAPYSSPSDPNISSLKSQAWAAGLSFGVLGKKQREWGVLGTYYKNKDSYLQDSMRFFNYNYAIAQRSITAGIYHRKYHHFTEKLFGGYQINLAMVAHSIIYDGASGDHVTRKGPLNFQLNANLFGGLLFTKHLGGRLAFGNAGIGYLFHREGNVFVGGSDDSDKIQANIGWLPSTAAQFSLFWIIRE